MRATVRPEGVLEHIALWGNLGPIPAAEAMFGMATSRVLMAGVRLGVFGALANKRATAAGIATVCAVSVEGAKHLLDCLTSLGYVDQSGQSEGPEGAVYSLAKRSRPWLDPDSPSYVGAFLEFNYDQWDWWSRLEEVVTTGQGFEIHEYGSDDPRWRRYIRAMYELARLSAPEIARKLSLTPDPTQILDLAGGHGWFAAELCKRHTGLSATVMDLPGSVEIGREIIAENGMSERVKHAEGNIMEDSLGGPYDGALCFQIIHHLSPEQNINLFKKVFAALKPGGTLAVMDYFMPREGKKPDSSAFLGLHFFLTSGASTYRVTDLNRWLAEAGFQRPRRVRLYRLPIQSVYEARKPE